jgi:hypothetical protein
MRLVRPILFVAGAVLLAYLIVRIGTEPIAEALARLTWWQFALVCLPHALIAVVDTLGWRYAFAQDRVPFSALLGARIAGEAVNLVTAVASVGGEAVKAWSIRRDVSYRESVPSLIIAKTTSTVGQVLFLLVGLGGGRCPREPPPDHAVAAARGVPPGSGPDRDHRGALDHVERRAQPVQQRVVSEMPAPDTRQDVEVRHESHGGDPVPGMLVADPLRKRQRPHAPSKGRDRAHDRTGRWRPDQRAVPGERAAQDAGQHHDDVVNAVPHHAGAGVVVGASISGVRPAARYRPRSC